MPDQDAGPQQDADVSRRLIELLRSRVRSNQCDDLVAYFNSIFPEYHSPHTAHPSLPIQENRKRYHLEELLQYHDQEFIEAIYAAVLKRAVDEDGLAQGLAQLRSGHASRIKYLGHLCYSEEGKQSEVSIRGLPLRFFLTRLTAVPVLGMFAGALLNFDRLAFLDVEVAGLRGRARRLQRPPEWFESQREENLHEAFAGRTIGERGLSVALPKLGTDEEVVLAELERLPVLLSLYGEDFVRAAFLVVLAREPAPDEMDRIQHQLDEGLSSRVRVLGELCASPDAVRSIDSIPGLRRACRLERRERIPLLGFFLRLPHLLRVLARLDLTMEYNVGALAGSRTRLTGVEADIYRHYNDSIAHLRSELVEAFRQEEP